MPWLMDEVTRLVKAQFPLWDSAPLSREAEWGAVYLAARHSGVPIQGI